MQPAMEQAKFLSLLYLIFIFISMFISTTTAITPVSSNTKPPSKTTETYTDFIKTSCNATTYPSVCLTSLIPYATAIKSNPIRLVKQALSAALKSASATRSTISKLSKTKNITKSHATVLKDCIGEIQDSIDEIKDSWKAISSLGSTSVNKKFVISNAQAWTSAAITDEYTCNDELLEMEVSEVVRKKIRNRIVSIAKLSSNALYLMNHLDI